MPKITVEPDYTDEDFAGAVEELLVEGRLITSRRVADKVGCSRELARQYLVRQAEGGALERDRVGGGAVVYLAPGDTLTDVEEYRFASAQKQHGGGTTDSGSGGVAPAQKPDERILFFPSRREIVVHHPADHTRQVLSQNAHLVDSTGQGYLYKVDEADIWNAPYDEFEDLKADLISLVGEADWSPGFEDHIRDSFERARQFRLRTHADGYNVLEAEDRQVFEDVAKRHLQHNDHYTQYVGEKAMRLKRGAEADVKGVLYDAGYPVIDERRLDEGASLDVQLVGDIELRDYQQEWVDAFTTRRSGVYVGPSGSGKTIAAIGTMEAVGGETLILVPSRELANQWEDELLEKTDLRRHQIGQYHGGEKRIRPVTIATYDTAAMSRHRKLFNEREWGLVIADECHHAVADTWKRFTEIQSVARLGLSATPVRESGDAKEIYTLIGPPVGTDWGRLFREGYVEKPDVELVMVPWASENHRERYQRASGNRKLIEAAKNPAKADVIRELLDEHAGQKALVFVDWIKQGKELAETLELPFVSGQTSHTDREQAYQDMRDGTLRALIVSRVGDEGIDLPDAEVAILASTMGSSRAQTGQRGGRTMRPSGESQVYLVLTKGSGEADWGRDSTQYLAEKGIDVSKREWR